MWRLLFVVLCGWLFGFIESVPVAFASFGVSAVAFAGAVIFTFFAGRYGKDAIGRMVK